MSRVLLIPKKSLKCDLLQLSHFFFTMDNTHNNKNVLPTSGAGRLLGQQQTVSGVVIGESNIALESSMT